MKSSISPAPVLLLCLVLAMSGCSELFGPFICGGDKALIIPSSPDTVTIHVGGSATATAGEIAPACYTLHPIRDFIWHSSDEAIAATTRIDTIRVRIDGLRPGSVLVTPAYRESGAQAPSVKVTVVP